MASTIQSLGQIPGVDAHFCRIPFFFFFFFVEGYLFVKQMPYMMHERYMRSKHGDAILQIPASETLRREEQQETGADEFGSVDV